MILLKWWMLCLNKLLYVLSIPHCIHNVKYILIESHKPWNFFGVRRFIAVLLRELVKHGVIPIMTKSFHIYRSWLKNWAVYAFWLLQIIKYSVCLNCREKSLMWKFFLFYDVFRHFALKIKIEIYSDRV